MSDTFSTEERSRIMKAVHSRRNQSTELKLVSYFRKYSINGWRRNCKVFGHPDFVFPKRKIAVFVDGCFWHGHNCRNVKPKNNAGYWKNKVKKNKKRDRIVNNELSKKGWRVIRLWECKLNKLARNRII
ncbi:MAG: DNA mismatch endonuclease Vsr [Candidatus Omnitrophica bacterium]|nr:DNA mismatch endonuclease Vsr [Candidatus Omnitrophota bacterium]